MTIEASPLKPYARRLRRDSTEVEKKLWHKLRARRFQGAWFRRQHVILPYIVDFCCVGARLIIELDGGQHNENADDLKRDDFLKSQGWIILRFWNNQVNENMDGVLMAISEALGESHPLSNSLPPAGERTGLGTGDET